MSVRPGILVAQRSSPPPRSAPTDTGVWNVVGLTDAGPSTYPVLISSMSDYERIFGARVSYSVLYDALDVYFREGGARAYVSRVVGPAATTGSKNMLDAGAAISLVASALGPGAGSANISVGVRAGVGAGTFVIFVIVGGVEVETSPDLEDVNAAVLWGMNSSYIRITLGASANDPAVVAAGALSAGADDRASITDTHWQAGLDRLSADLGTGQVSAPGQSTTARHLQLLDHAYTHRRAAILDAPDTGTSATLTALAAATRAGGTYEKYGALFAPWLVAPGVVPGTTRSVPPSALVAGLVAKNDAAGLGAVTPAAGDQGESDYITDITQPGWSDSVRNTLNTAGVNIVRRMFGAIRVYGWRSLVDPVTELSWLSFGHARLYMSIAADGASIAEGFLFDRIDGQGKKLSEFGGALVGMLMDYYRAGDLYGATPEEAFFVDVGNQVNTPTTLSLNELHAVLNVKMSPFAEFVQIDIVKRAITEGVS
jgi:phage tail sheath protein FI